jgi:hypothetical protein
VTSPAVDVLAGSTPGGGGSSQSWAHTTGTHANLMVVCAGASSGLLPTAVTYGGTSLTHLVSASSGSGSTDRTADIWYMTTPPAGLATVAVTYGTTTAGISGESVTFTGAGASAFGPSASFTSASTATATTTTNSVASALLLSFMCARTTSAPAAGGGESLRWTLLGGSNIYGAGATQSGGTNVTSTFTYSPADHCAMIAVPILGPVLGGSGGAAAGLAAAELIT